ncbi:MAG TPA: DeoR/GlpR family DNA-binding transcription regulator [Ktedonobacteraceae bacterium]|jgi:DeoR/GlpR family transcriptional regulator of sugar metabolism|nr:DeoR/GlpR family DNA-binding transcription regulator [Ktedonobacteraceae bacterium]
MGKRRQSAADRHTQLIELLKTHGYCSVTEMSQALNVSPMTIRRDLHTLHEKQIAEVTFGGARLTASKEIEPDFDIRARECLREKQAIGKQAAELFIEEGDVVGIDSGSTTLEVARNLPNVPLTVVTPSLAAANVVAQNSLHPLIMPGGALQQEASCFYGPLAITALRTLYINKLFLATSGLLVSDGLSSSNLPDAEIKQALINSSRQIILCMDSSKVGKVFLARFSALDAIDALVTDSGLADEDREAIERHHVQVITVPTLATASGSLSLANGTYKP